MVDASLILTVVSLIIAIIAFVVATAQALLQFAGSAEGYRQCREHVMGRWGAHTKRVFAWEEFRFKVMLRTPVLFVARPENDRGPMGPDRPIHAITGTLESYENTHCRKPSQQAEDPSAGAIRVHTTDDELASWVILMETLHKAEAEGWSWDLEQALQGQSKPRGRVLSTLVVQVQEKQRSWDQMPDGVKKPFATTNISHVVEIAALLGLQWVKFDQDTWNLRAEGNGLMLLSQPIWGLGVSVSFSVTGKTTFQEKRMIPCRAVKALSFGTVDTTFPDLQLNFEPKKEAWEDMYVTQRTLRRLKLNRKTMERYFDRKEHSVVRSVNFEIIAMLGQVFRIPGSSFKRIPNPTPDPWLTDLDPCRIHVEFQNNIARMMHDANSSATDQLLWIHQVWNERLQPRWKERVEEIDIDMRNAVQAVLEQCDTYLHTCGEPSVIFVVGAHVSAVLEEINDPQSFLHSRECDTEAEIWSHYFEHIWAKVHAFPGMSVAEEKMKEKKMAMISSSVPSAAKLRQDMWLTLMCRMSLWWLLHDFDERDTLIIPTTVKESRMPVYIL